MGAGKIMRKMSARVFRRYLHWHEWRELCSVGEMYVVTGSGICVKQVSLEIRKRPDSPYYDYRATIAKVWKAVEVAGFPLWNGIYDTRRNNGKSD